VKQALIIFGLLTLTMIAQARPQIDKPQLKLELCDLETDASDDTFTEIRTIDIDKTKTLSPFLLKLANEHLIAQGYVKTEQTLPEIKALFGEKGEESFNDLYIVFFISKKTGQKYIQVKTWPGDNPMGLIFEADSGKLVGHNSDDSISLVTLSGGDVSCYELSK